MSTKDTKDLRNIRDTIGHAGGKALRKEVPRSSHAGWSPTADRPDPVDLITSQNESRILRHSIGRAHTVKVFGFRDFTSGRRPGDHIHGRHSPPSGRLGDSTTEGEGQICTVHDI